jgi:hypothetical protein
MNAKEINFAYQVRHALNENLENLPAATTERLAAARHVALSRKKKDSALHVFAVKNAMAGPAGGFFAEQFSWMSRMGVAVPLFALMISLVGIYQVEQQERISETAELDADVLSDELPLSAYLDHGFNAYLTARGE